MAPPLGRSCKTRPARLPPVEPGVNQEQGESVGVEMCVESPTPVEMCVESPTPATRVYSGSSNSCRSSGSSSHSGEP